MKISYNWLKDYIQKLPKPEKLADLLTMHSFETELVSLLDQQQNSDVLLDVDVLPNRSHDCLSHLGIAGECAAILDKKLKKPEIKLKEESVKVNQKLEIEVNNPEDCLRYTARVIEEVKVEESPSWLKERLKSCGLKPINNIVDAVNYVMLEYGQPLHAFDFKKIDSFSEDKRKLIVRRAQKGEKIVSLDNENYKLDEDILVIANRKDPLCIAGVKGGKIAEVTKDTKSIVLEAANFNPSLVRRMSQKLNLRTDASWRFENEIDPNLTEEAIDRAAYLIQKIAQGNVLKNRVDFYPKKRIISKIKLDTEKVCSVLGVDISTDLIVKILKRLNFEVKKQRKSVLVTIPTSRLDLNLPEDLIEEVMRLYGLDHIDSKLPEASISLPERNENLFYSDKVKNLLSAIGFNEVYSYSFIGDRFVDVLNFNPDNLAEILKPISQDQKYLRPCLAFNLIEAAILNKRYFDEVNLFEIGNVFKLEKSLLKENKRLGGVASFKEKTKKAEEFYFLKGVIENLFNSLGIADVWFNDNVSISGFLSDFIFNSLRAAEIQVNGEVIGLLAETDKVVLNKLGAKQKVSFFELDFNKLVKLATEERIYEAPSKYPAIVRDISVLVNETAKVEEVMNLIHSSGGRLIRDIDLFDVYEDKEAGGKKSLAFHIIFQSKDNTLTDKEVNKLQDKIINTLEKEGNWEVRR